MLGKVGYQPVKLRNAMTSFFQKHVSARKFWRGYHVTGEHGDYGLRREGSDADGDKIMRSWSLTVLLVKLDYTNTSHTLVFAPMLLTLVADNLSKST
jgi:hypothetical protein